MFPKSWSEIQSGKNWRIIPPEFTIATLKEIILNSNECKKDLNFVQEIQWMVVIERKERQKMKLKHNEEKEKENIWLY